MEVMNMNITKGKISTALKVGKNAKVIADYIKNQLEEDYMSDQMTMKEYTDPFTGSKNNKA